MLIMVLDVAKKACVTVRGCAALGLTTREQLAPTRKIRGNTEKVEAVAFFKDGRRVVTGSWDCTLRILDVLNGVLVGGPFEGHKVNSVAVSPDDRRIASAGHDNTIIIWDVGSKQKVLGPLVKHTDPVYSVCFSPDGNKLASGSRDTTVVIWDAETGAVLATLPHRDWVLSVSFSPDGLQLASASADCTIKVWRTNDAGLLLNINAHQDFVRCVVWSPDGQHLVSAADDKTINFWNSFTGDQIGQPCTGHTNTIYSLAISSDGSFIATASVDNTVRLWSTKTHQQIGQTLEHAADVCCVTISPNQELLITGDDEGKVLFWSIENMLSAVFGLDSSYASFFVRRSKAKFGRKLYADALHDAEKVIEFNPSSYVGYKLKHSALHGAQRRDEAIESFKVMLSKLDDAPDPQLRQLRQKYVSPSEVEHAIRQGIYAHLGNAPLRLLNTSTGRLCNREAQILDFKESTEYKELFYSLMMHTPLQTEHITKAVERYFSWVMLSHRWERKEPLLHDIRDKVVYKLKAVGGIRKLQMFCNMARAAVYRWAWVDTCCIDQNNNVELQESVNSMFTWYRHSALTIVYLSDVPPASKSGALADSTWNTRGWTVQEFLAPKIILFYQANWTLYLGDRSPNHKESIAIMQELENSTGIDAQSLVAFRPGMRGAREKLRWASSRVTTLQEDIVYSLFGIFGVHLPVIYGEKKQNALGRLLQEIIAHSGDITTLDWVGKPSEFNSCLPADITSYKAPPCTLPSLSEDEMLTAVSTLRNITVVESASKLYTLLDNLSVPRFANSRLQLPCIAFPITEVRRRRGQDRESCFTYDIRADGLQDLMITTGDRLIQFSPARPTPQTFLLIRPWNRHDLGLPDFSDDTQSVYESMPDSPLDDSPSGCSGDERPAETESHSRELRLIVRLGQPFGALFLAQQRGLEYKRIVSDHNIIAQVKDMTCVHDMMDIRTLEIL